MSYFISDFINYFTSRWLPITLILGSLLAVFYVYRNRTKLLQLRPLKRRSKP